MECAPLSYGYRSFVDPITAGILNRRCTERKRHRHFQTLDGMWTIYNPNFVPPPHYRPAPDWMYQDHFDWRELAVLARIYNPLDHAHDQGERDLSHPQFRPIDVHPDYYEGKG